MVHLKPWRACWIVIVASLFLVSGFNEAQARVKENKHGRPIGKPIEESIAEPVEESLGEEELVLVDSSLTTLMENGFSAEEVLLLLADAGFTGLEESDLYREPVAGLEGLETFTDDQLTLLQADISVSNFLIRLGNPSWGPADPGEVGLLTEAAEMTRFCLSQNRYQAVAEQLNPTLADFTPRYNLDYLIRAARNMTETVSLWTSNGEIGDPVTVTESLVDSIAELVLHYYVQENRGDAAIEEAILYEILPDIDSTQYPQIDFAGWVVIYNQDGTVANPDDGTTSDTETAGDSSTTTEEGMTTEPEPTVYPAPVLEAVTVEGSNFILTWTLPDDTSEVPSGGYDVIINGTDTGTTWRTEQTSAVISGLQAGVEHSFHIQARWLQADPHQVPYSNALSGTIPLYTEDALEPTEEATEPSDTFFSGPVKAFPGAVGFGTETVAGRGGQIIKVTNLNDSGTGSLRAAIDTSGPRIIVFEVGGVIALKSDLRISDGYVTIAGQTAPFPGIMLKGYGVRISTSNVLMQHLAIRVGDDGRTADGSWDNADALQIIGSGSSNIVIDHCSWSWGIDENSSVWGSNMQNITFSNNLIGEALVSSVHTKGSHSKGLLVGGDNSNPKRVAIIGNLFVHNVDRNPQLKGGTSTVVANNLMYNCGDNYSISNMTRNYVSEKTLASYLGNVFIDGPQSASGAYAIKAESNLASGSAFYASDNVNLSRPAYLVKDNSGAKVTSPPLAVADLQPLSSDKVIDSVLTYVGSRPAQRDAVDARVVQEVLAGTGSRKNSSAGLWPSYPASSRSLDPYLPIDPHGDDNGDGYTNIEHVLYDMARQVEGH